VELIKQHMRFFASGQNDKVSQDDKISRHSSAGIYSRIGSKDDLSPSMTLLSMFADLKLSSLIVPDLRMLTSNGSSNPGKRW
jgi:hypothetical protein